MKISVLTGYLTEPQRYIFIIYLNLNECKKLILA
jgi:hypothetical protein